MAITRVWLSSYNVPAELITLLNGLIVLASMFTGVLSITHEMTSPCSSESTSIFSLEFERRKARRKQKKDYVFQLIDVFWGFFFV